jgi:hypothetical protein
MAVMMMVMITLMTLKMELKVDFSRDALSYKRYQSRVQKPLSMFHDYGFVPKPSHFCIRIYTVFFKKNLLTLFFKSGTNP